MVNNLLLSINKDHRSLNISRPFKVIWQNITNAKSKMNEKNTSCADFSLRHKIILYQRTRLIY